MPPIDNAAGNRSRRKLGRLVAIAEIVLMPLAKMRDLFSIEANDLNLRLLDMLRALGYALVNLLLYQCSCPQ
jgi:hypothetical protein